MLKVFKTCHAFLWGQINVIKNLMQYVFIKITIFIKPN
jgi:hypothetical protein